MRNYIAFYVICMLTFIGLTYSAQAEELSPSLLGSLIEESNKEGGGSNRIFDAICSGIEAPIEQHFRRLESEVISKLHPSHQPQARRLLRAVTNCEHYLVEISYASEFYAPISDCISVVGTKRTNDANVSTVERAGRKIPVYSIADTVHISPMFEIRSDLYREFRRVLNAEKEWDRICALLLTLCISDAHGAESNPEQICPIMVFNYANQNSWRGSDVNERIAVSFRVIDYYLPKPFR